MPDWLLKMCIFMLLVHANNDAIAYPPCLDKKCCKNPKTWQSWTRNMSRLSARWCPSDILSLPLADMFIWTWWLYLHALNKHNLMIHFYVQTRTVCTVTPRLPHCGTEPRTEAEIEDNPRRGSAPRYGALRSYLTRKISLFTKVAEQCKPNYSELGQKSASKE